MTRIKHAARSDVRRWCIAAALGCLSLSASAFTSPTPPPGFEGTPGNWTYKPPSPAEQVGKIMRGPGPSVAGSGATTAAFRLGPSAARALARGVIGGGIAGIAVAGAAWLLENCFAKQGNQWVRTCGGTTPPQSDGFEYALAGTAVYLPTRAQGCVMGGAAINAFQVAYGVTVLSASMAGVNCIISWRHANGNTGTWTQGFSGRVAPSCPAGWYITQAGCVQTPPPQYVTPQEVEDGMADKPLPQTLPPGFPYPLDPTSPSIWNPDTANPPNSRPMRVPQGNPVPVPNTNPQQYKQPVVRVQHSPTATDPWRMDEQPESVTGESPTGQTGPETVGSGSPPSTPAEEDKRDLCEKNPDILACSKPELDIPEGEIPKETKTITYQAESPFGGGSCPADKMVSSGLAGRSFKAVDWGQWCSYGSSYIRPLIILLATISAFFIVALGRDAE